MRVFLFLLIGLLLSSCEKTQKFKLIGKKSVKPDWVLSEGLCDPETIIEMPDSDLLIVSNICAFEKNDKGYLSLITADGAMVKERWVEGLNAPAGMDIYDGDIFIADFDRLTKIDIETEETEFILPDIEVGAFNDVASDDQGTIYLSDSAKHRVVAYNSTNNNWSVLKEHEFKYANGLHWDDGLLWVGSESLWRLDLETNVKTRIAVEGLSDIDGIEVDDFGGMSISKVGGNVWYISIHGDVTEWTTEGLSSTNHYHNPKNQKILVPTGFDNTIIAFEIEN